jgi:hypothetical protein
MLIEERCRFRFGREEKTFAKNFVHCRATAQEYGNYEREGYVICEFC